MYTQKETYLTHQLGRFNFGASGNDLTLTNSLRLGRHGKRVLQIVAENNILDEHGLDLHTPPSCYVFDDLRGGLGDLLTAFNHILQDSRSDDMAQSGLGALDKRLSYIADTEGGFVGRDDLVIDNRRQVQSDIVLGHTDLTRHLDDLDLHIDCG